MTLRIEMNQLKRYKFPKEDKNKILIYGGKSCF